MKLKQKAYYFFISFIITSCVIYGCFGVCAAYESISAVSGGHKKAVEIKKDGIRILDFEFRIKQ
ncbi:MAG: hypothetical protein IKZ47_01770 [Clostridia bacterium]|nr:hypothetical protein [Clostridia bacterium]